MTDNQLLDIVFCYEKDKIQQADLLRYEFDLEFVKDKLIVVCNTASRAVIEAQAFKQMGFKTVKIYEAMNEVEKSKNRTQVISRMLITGGLVAEDDLFGSKYWEEIFKKSKENQN